MSGQVVLAFLAGVLVGLLGAVLLRKMTTKALVELPDPDILDVVCQPGGQVRIDCQLAAPGTGARLVSLHTRVDDDPLTSVPACPTNAVSHALPANLSSFSLVHPLPAGLQGPRDLATVWAVYEVCRCRSREYDTCTGNGSGSGIGPEPAKVATTRAVSPAAAGQLEAIPRAYRVMTGPAVVAASGGPAADLVGALAGGSGTVLEYVPEVSTPTEPFWRARRESGPIREWALCLLHRDGGFGALLSAVCLAGGRELRLTWVTSDWRFHGVNRILCESEEADGLSLLVRPA